jgi:hypothetical protein
MQWTRSGLTALYGAVLLAGCAATDGGDPWADSGPRPAGPAAGAPERSAGAGTAPPRAGQASARRADDDAGPTETSRPTGKVDWVAVFESPPGAKYSEQRVIYVDRNSVQPASLDKLTYYLARTREVTRSGAKPKIQEIAVICEGTPLAPATSLRGEGTEEGGGSYSLKRAATPLTSISQFSTQRLRADASNPNTFIVRAICMLGTGG